MFESPRPSRRLPPGGSPVSLPVRTRHGHLHKGGNIASAACRRSWTRNHDSLKSRVSQTRRGDMTQSGPLVPVPVPDSKVTTLRVPRTVFRCGLSTCTETPQWTGVIGQGSLSCERLGPGGVPPQGSCGVHLVRRVGCSTLGTDHAPGGVQCRRRPSRHPWCGPTPSSARPGRGWMNLE